jgi:hypothetical protein
MPEVATRKLEEETITVMTDMCSDLFKEWLFDLTLEEKEIWLWNALVEMDRIKQRRPLVS